jgi:uncharacterized protein YukE
MQTINKATEKLALVLDGIETQLERIADCLARHADQRKAED